MKKRISVSVDEEVYEWLAKKRENYLTINTSGLVNQLLIDYIKKEASQ